MAEKSYVWDGLTVGDATEAPYSATEWAAQRNLLQGIGASFPNYGVLSGTGGGTYEPLAVLATNPASTNVEVRSGAAMVNGKLYESTATVTLAIAANASGNARIDTVVLRIDYTLQTTRAVVLQGTPAASPARPTLTQNASTWEMPLADIAVANGFSTIGQTNITQRRRYVNGIGAGWQPHAYPMIFSPTAAFGTSQGLAANGETLLVPIKVTGNMLLASVSFYCLSINSNIVWGWDLYVQDVNDQNSAENTLRRVAQSDGNQSVTPLPGVPSTRTLSASGSFIPIPPGLYWLALQNRAPAVAFSVGSTAIGAPFGVTSGKTKVTTNPNGDTIDAVAATWTSLSAMFAVRLNGAVFGQATAYS